MCFCLVPYPLERVLLEFVHAQTVLSFQYHSPSFFFSIFLGPMHNPLGLAKVGSILQTGLTKIWLIQLVSFQRQLGASVNMNNVIVN